MLFQADSVLFSCLEIGSVIKHQLVAHLALGIALRGVLDALRKSIDSKVVYGYFLLSVISTLRLYQVIYGTDLMA